MTARSSTKAVFLWLLVAALAFEKAAAAIDKGDRIADGGGR
jgi:hypothetical protein